ncbi:5-formyltetrahydrofolate cyclo-ligase, partial [Ruminococcus sp.]|uniref:5-formyltetrahydrofolate cyclo-ligase n=1 Tax=Ruminococcus sp. TaxID=41978 RepID=UPI003AF5DF01
IKSLAEYKNADTIFCYVSTEKEINTIPLLQEILDSGKRLGVPKCTGKGIMDAYEIQNLEQLKIGSYGILEPGEECDIILDPTEIQFAIIPCISCNRKGERLGHGGGYYDRYLEKMPEDCEKAILLRALSSTQEYFGSIQKRISLWAIRHFLTTHATLTSLSKTTVSTMSTAEFIG